MLGPQSRAVIKLSNLQTEFVKLLHPEHSINHTATMNTTLLIILDKTEVC